MKLGYKFLATLMLVAVGCGSKSDGTDIINDPVGAGDGGASGGSNGMGGPGGTGASGGTSNGDNGLGNNDGTKCGGGVVRAMPNTPDMLIVLDRSGSMGGASLIPPGLDCTKTDIATRLQCGLAGVDCTNPQYMNTTVCGGTMPVPSGDRWTPSVAAIKGLTSSLEDTVRFGLMAYPGEADQCAAGDMYVEPNLKTAAQIAMELDGMGPDGATPTSLTLEAANNFFAGIVAGPDSGANAQYVLLVTDGDPNCVGDTNMEAQEASYAAISALAAKGVKTYVIGYDSKMSNFATVLDEMARRGNTGDTAHRAVEDQASLEKEFQEIAGSVVSCDFKLEKEPPDPTYVLVEVDGKQLNLNDKDNGWTIKGKVVTVTGKSCETLQDGKDHTLNVEVKCEVVPII